MRVVDQDRNAAVVGNLFEPPRNRLEPTNPLSDEASVDTQRAANAHCAEDILQIRRTDERRMEFDPLLSCLDRAAETADISLDL